MYKQAMYTLCVIIVVELSILLLLTYSYFKNKNAPAELIGGKLATIEEFPFYVVLIYAPYNTVICGGSIISIKVILTAAHCVYNEDKDYLQVFTGMTSLDDLHYKYPYEIQKIITHPSYNKRIPGFYDLALLELKSTIEFDDDAEIVPLATRNPPIGALTTVAGFGVVECVPGTQDCRDADHLRTAAMKVKGIGTGESIKSEGIGSNVCYGDSGGPMIYESQIVGVASTVDYVGCMPGGNTYTAVYLSLDWIRENAIFLYNDIYL